MAATTTSFAGGSPGHYLRQFSRRPARRRCRSRANRDSNNRGNTYPPSLWLAQVSDFSNGNFPSWDCKNTGARGDGSVPASGEAPTPGSREACWVAPLLPGAPGQYQIPHIGPATYSNTASKDAALRTSRSAALARLAYEGA